MQLETWLLQRSELHLKYKLLSNHEFPLKWMPQVRHDLWIILTSESMIKCPLNCVKDIGTDIEDAQCTHSVTVATTLPSLNYYILIFILIYFHFYLFSHFLHHFIHFPFNIFNCTFMSMLPLYCKCWICFVLNAAMHSRNVFNWLSHQ